MLQHVVRISDGLGNQMFQYAFAYALARRTGAEVLIDPLFWGTSLRKYQLEKFKVTNTKRMVSRVWDYILGFGPRNGRRFKDGYRQFLIRKKYQLIKEKQVMCYDENLVSQTRPSFYMGFWQTPRYFEAYYEELKSQFVRKKNISVQALDYQKRIQEETSVALHIRRTDYVRQEGNAALGFEFYEEALHRMQDRLGAFQLFVFTDDKEFVKKNFKLREYVLVDKVCDLDEFELMRQCDHHIIANSTFSWWAAYLGMDKGGIVYAPCTGIWSQEFYPKEWNLIDTKTDI
ncbi:alpha-1,2-fucosyltransferase [Parablautia intestinalis]|uniref:alpha-1,2-fucosyltransferase n=1 Tax=Parablautia intestinalis TaxID=2320100 RepID=UPI00256F5949|nr:alpha-1,2-fucosyltransferase [Parablautia intestinalis]